MPNQQIALTEVFFSLSDPTRRAILKRLSKGPASISELAKPFQMALPSFMQHIEVLADCGLIRSKKVGRVRTCELTPQKLKIAEAWLIEQRGLWEKQSETLDEFLSAVARGKK